MHRHGYKGRKFGREKGPRTALIRSLAESLARDGSIVTTKPKAKELVPYFEKLITKAKTGTLASRRAIMRDLSVPSSHKLVDDIAPKLKARSSGHLRVKSEGWRIGDNAELARVSFVDDIKSKAKPEGAKPSAKAQKPKAEKSAAVEKPATKATRSRTTRPTAQSAKVAPRRTGVRGNR